MKTKKILSIACATALTTFTSLQTMAGPGGHGGGGGSTRPSKSCTSGKTCKPQTHQTAPKTTMGASLATKDPGVKAREGNQRDRITQGIKSGQLTKEEATTLASTQKSIHQEEAQYKSDGVLTTAERKDLHSDLNAASKQIYQEKHDTETQTGATPATSKSPCTKDPGVDARPYPKKHALESIPSGESTKAEISSLTRKEDYLNQIEQQLKADSSLSPEDRLQLQKIQEYLSASIHKQKKDAPTGDDLFASTSSEK